MAGKPRSRVRCGARRKRDGEPCQAPALANGRCKLHGGLSTGPRTPEGWARIAAAKHAWWARWRQERAAGAVTHSPGRRPKKARSPLAARRRKARALGWGVLIEEAKTPGEAGFAARHAIFKLVGLIDAGRDRAVRDKHPPSIDLKARLAWAQEMKAAALAKLAEREDAVESSD